MRFRTTKSKIPKIGVAEGKGVRFLNVNPILASILGSEGDYRKHYQYFLITLPYKGGAHRLSLELDWVGWWGIKLGVAERAKDSLYFVSRLTRVPEYLLRYPINIGLDG